MRVKNNKTDYIIYPVFQGDIFATYGSRRYRSVPKAELISEYTPKEKLPSYNISDDQMQTVNNL
jgi:hypothetical protein